MKSRPSWVRPRKVVSSRLVIQPVSEVCIDRGVMPAALSASHAAKNSSQVVGNWSMPASANISLL